MLRPGYAILVKIWKGLKLLNTVPLIMKMCVIHVYSWILSFLLTFTVSQWLKTNLEISQLSGFLLRPRYAILVQIWKSLKLLNSVPFINRTHVNHVYNWIWSFWLTFTVLQWWMKTNLKISKFSRFVLYPRNVILVKIWK